MPLLTAGEPEWNGERVPCLRGIARWSQRKASVTTEDTCQRALKTIGMLRDNPAPCVPTDVTDPSPDRPFGGKC